MVGGVLRQKMADCADAAGVGVVGLARAVGGNLGHKLVVKIQRVVVQSNAAQRAGHLHRAAGGNFPVGALQRQGGRAAAQTGHNAAGIDLGNRVIGHRPAPLGQGGAAGADLTPVGILVEDGGLGGLGLFDLHGVGQGHGGHRRTAGRQAQQQGGQNKKQRFHAKAPFWQYHTTMRRRRQLLHFWANACTINYILLQKGGPGMERTAGGITYTLTRRRVRNINLRVRADGSVAASASPRVPAAYVDAFVTARADWVRTAQARAAARREREAAEAPALPPKAEALAYMQALCRAYYPQFAATCPGGAMPKIAVRDMNTRWGSCSLRTGTLAFARRLCAMPLPAQEYVVVHEFCHFAHPDHSPAFWAAVAEVLPDYKQRERMLKLR